MDLICATDQLLYFPISTGDRARKHSLPSKHCFIMKVHTRTYNTGTTHLGVDLVFKMGKLFEVMFFFVVVVIIACSLMEGQRLEMVLL